jgi:hypothetical protein
MNRLVIGSALGGVAMYFLDSERGARRRSEAAKVWRERGGAAMEAVEPYAHEVRRRWLSRVGWPGSRGRIVEVNDMRKTLFAAALGGALVFFLDPERGEERRRKLMSFWNEKRGTAIEAGRNAAARTTEVVKPRAEEVGKKVTTVFNDAKSKVT